MPERPVNPEDLNLHLQDMLRRIRALERIRLQLPEDSDALQTFEGGKPLGDTRFLDFGAGINASLVGDDYVLVEGSGGGGGSWATVTVAASNSHPKAQEEADFVCTGVNDEVTLNAAVAECHLRCTIGAGSFVMGKIGLYQGTYFVQAPWTNTVVATPREFWFQGMGIGTEIRAVSGWSGANVVSMSTSYSGGGRNICSDMYINGNGQSVTYGLRFDGPFTPNPTTFRNYAWNLLVDGASEAQIRTGEGQRPPSYIDNTECNGGQVGIWADSVNPSRITNCRIRSATLYGILSRGRVSGCSIEACDVGIYMNNTGSGSIDGNENDNQVTGNFINGNNASGVVTGDIGIYCSAVSGVVVGNDICNVGEYGILVGGGTAGSGSRNVISGNRVRNTGSDGTFAGIRIEGAGDENLIIGNKVRSATGFGLQLVAGADNNIDAFNDLRNNTGGEYTDAGTGNLHYPTTPGTGLAPSNADYLVGTANADLSAEIVVGTTPGGELGGTWASPTVDATHSGSSHGVAVEDEGAAEGQALTIDFAGAGVSVAFAGTEATVTIPGASGGHVIEDEGTPLAAQPNLNFVGAGVTATDATPDTLVTIPGVGTPTAGWGSIVNALTDRAYDADSTTLNELADVLATLVADLISQGILSS